MDDFTVAYLECAEWASREDTWQEDLSWSDEARAQAQRECLVFQDANADDLCGAGSPEQNGHDFFLTRNRHGTGFWDRGYPRELADRLTTAAEAAGDRDVYVGDDGLLYFYPHTWE